MGSEMCIRDSASPINSVIVVSGTPGSGKTTLARQLAEHQSDSAIASWAKSEPEPLQLDGPLIVADTSRPVNISELTNRIRAVA